MGERRSLIGWFFGGIWKLFEVFRKLLIALTLLISVGLFALLFLSATPPAIEENVALVWAPQGALVEQQSMPAGGVLPLLLGEAPPQTEVRDLLDALHYAANDNRIKMLYLKLDGLDSAGFGQLQSLTRALEKFRKSGKKVIAFAPQYSQAQYLLAAQADELYLDPLGAVVVAGMSRHAFYYREALDKIGIEMQIFRAGTYKSAVEPFERNDMSLEAGAATRAWLDVLWRDYTRSVGAARKLPPADVHAYAEELPERSAASGGDLARVALDAGLVDELVPLHEVRRRVGATVGMDDSHGSFRQVNFRNYLARVRREQREESPSRIGWLVVEGALVDGEGDPGNAGADAIARSIDDLTREKKLKALVVRVNSPGGSVTASETLRRALRRFADTDRPVVISMAAVAASGGYWMSMDADQIWGEAGTLTGSIGVFGMLPNLQEPLARLGIHSDGVATTDTAGDLRLDRPLTEEAKAAVQAVVNHSYQLFLDGVAEGRNLSEQAARDAAEGRVWSGEDALRLGLLDHLGGPQEAIAAAADLAGIEAFRLEVVKTTPDLVTLMRRRFKLSLQSQLPWLADWLQPVSQALGSLNWLQDPRGIYAHCLCETPLARY